MPIHEDIFGAGNAIGLIVRWNDTIIGEFDKRNSKTFEQLKKLIDGQELKCYFLKVKDNEQKIIIPFTGENFQFELYVDWDEKTFSYKAKVKSNKKSRIIEPISIPEEREYFIEEACKLVFIDINESRFPVKEQVNLFDRIKKLEILPKTKIENDREIWDKWIEAQDLLLKRNAQPFKVKKYHQPIEVKNDNEATTRYKFKVDLFVDDSSEYKEVEEELLNKFSINETFDEEGNIFLKFDDIYRGLDAVIHKKFKEKVEREKGITTILKLKPKSPSDNLISKAKDIMPDCTFSFDNRNKHFSIFSSRKAENIIPKEIITEFQLKRIGIIAAIRISEAGGTARTEFQKKEIRFNIKDRAFEREKALFNKSIIDYRNTLFKDHKNINSIKFKVGEYYEVGNTTVESFTEEFWDDIKRDIYTLDFKVETNTSTGTISYDFETKEECIEKLKKLQAINKFQFTISPEQPDFKFKVKTNLLKNKTEKQIFFERISNLANVDFQVQIGEEGNRKKYLPIGKLIAQESDLSSLIFSIPIRRKDEQKLTKQLLEYIEEKKPINQVEANLKGDQAKISWLKQAMKKVVEPGERHFEKAINEKLGQFIFDSSKAEEVFKDILPDSEEWNRVKRNELLKLNDSQRKAILSALHARDLCLLQGPPGTGKTTVIAELIWQLISQNQEHKVLLTSETNLAVDNALEKLLNKEHTLVKPLRFGKDTKFEEEGKKYSFNRIMKWIDEKFVPVEYEEDSLEENEDEEEIAPDNPYNNAVQIWMNRIAEKSHKEINPKYASALKDWAIELTQSETSVKQLFKDKYFKYANVVGSTCSSAGSPSFMKSYQFIYNKKADFIDDPTKRWTWIPVEFDSVIMDEASKATPPEMLLPLCFGKKSIVIGDHKQLPPMLNEKEFKEALSELKDEKAIKLAEEIDREFVETSQFERLIMNPKVPKSIAARLNIQYRMHPKINNVIKQFYTGETDEGLEPAQELIDYADTEDLSNPFSRHHGLWNENFIKPDIHTIWINVNEPEEQSGTSRVNEKEVEAVKSVLQYLKNSRGFEDYFNHWEKIKNEDKRLQEQEIGIISFYGHQVKKLQEVRRYAQKDLNLPIRLKTVDKFQGMERNIIIVSTVRSDKLIKGGLVEKNSDIGFAKAPERLNVALSRARRLLIVVGNLKFFENYKDKNGNAIYKNAIDIIRKEGWIIEDYKTLSKHK
ncbi:MAG: AAA family ATPase [Bacteroidetes bacterium]|nr:AAA family ATPase [Bacteroidota bacterium]